MQLVTYPARGAASFSVDKVALRLRGFLAEKLGNNYASTGWSRLSDSELAALSLYVAAGDPQLAKLITALGLQLDSAVLLGSFPFNNALRQLLTADGLFLRPIIQAMSDPKAAHMGTADGQYARLVLRCAEIINAALHKLPKFSGLVYRGVDLPESELAKHVPGAVIM